MIEKIEHNDLLYALIIRSEFKGGGVEFFTKNEYPLQMGYMNRDKGYTVSKHKHSVIEPTLIDGINQEILVMRSGLVKVDIYGQKNEYIASVTIKKGDVIMFMRGGHGFEMLEASDFIEIKQGPYGGPTEKILF